MVKWTCTTSISYISRLVSIHVVHLVLCELYNFLPSIGKVPDLEHRAVSTLIIIPLWSSTSKATHISLVSTQDFQVSAAPNRVCFSQRSDPVNGPLNVWCQAQESTLSLKLWTSCPVEAREHKASQHCASGTYTLCADAQLSSILLDHI